MRQSNVEAVQLSNVIPRRSRSGRDPYDGLRPWSAITHGAGAVLALVGTLALLSLTAAAGSLRAFWSFAIYGLSMICLYTASTLYHCVNASVRGRLALRKYDHCSIYLLIAGSYTPVCLLALERARGLWLFGVVWLVAAAGLALSIAWIDSPRWLTSGVYLFMGWLALSALGPIVQGLTPGELAWLVLGGVLYTVGGILYAVKWPGRHNPRFGCHEIFHVFILLGSVCHFILMFSLALRL